MDLKLFLLFLGVFQTCQGYCQYDNAGFPVPGVPCNINFVPPPTGWRTDTFNWSVSTNQKHNTQYIVLQLISHF